ncbi:nitrate reductase molybdenum cofactor assembly chaperone [Alsobacter sp. SYSU M60028]|uniref:Nitrate reductase molybdenum cofactor assembly chaperone n=1 Tax=Alsobacter ponti TaxID=2962936 RepID=A0ABT1LDR5_9HYPH|nr:nitrate reductase molybdenum cofactor assembly chaperone [Alsobacter ponti]MCP8939564.1 nitrate reductase molybdenum cofactor assembly chaperone [Alsobacter ponti]
MKTLKVLSAVLSYPTAELAAAADELKAIVAREGLLPPAQAAALSRLIDDIAGRDLLDAQERYVQLFDRTRSLSLQLFEHVHGESRDRGQAMVDLLRLYEEGGYTPTASELPDFLPLFLEYAATRQPDDALELIGQPGHVFAALRERLAKRDSVYEGAFAALVALAGGALDDEALAALRAEPDVEPDDLEALDAAWQDEEVTFGPGAADACGVDSLASKIRQARRPAPGLETPAGAGPRTVITTPNTARA